MRPILVCAFVLILAAGCKPATPPGPAPAPPPAPKKFVEVPATPPTLAAVAYRPEFVLGGEVVSAGTAFVVRAKTGDKYLLTAAHLFEPAEWKTVQRVELLDFKGKEVGRSTEAAIYVGKGMDPDRNETEFDLVIFKLAPNDTTTPLPLAAEYPNQNRLWAVGAEVTSRDGLQKTFELNPTSSIAGKNTVLMNKAARFNLQAFSGGPIVDHEGKVVASLLGGNDVSVIGSSVVNLRKRLVEKGIDVE